jgi:hypothetical protein
MPKVAPAEKRAQEVKKDEAPRTPPQSEPAKTSTKTETPDSGVPEPEPKAKEETPPDAGTHDAGTKSESGSDAAVMSADTLKAKEEEKQALLYSVYLKKENNSLEKRNDWIYALSGNLEMRIV